MVVPLVHQVQAKMQGRIAGGVFNLLVARYSVALRSAANYLRRPWAVSAGKDIFFASACHRRWWIASTANRFSGVEASRNSPVARPQNACQITRCLQRPRRIRSPEAKLGSVRCASSSAAPAPDSGTVWIDIFFCIQTLEW
jgi:hypothetical protein